MYNGLTYEEVKNGYWEVVDCEVENDEDTK